VTPAFSGFPETRMYGGLKDLRMPREGGIGEHVRPSFSRALPFAFASGQLDVYFLQASNMWESP